MPSPGMMLLGIALVMLQAWPHSLLQAVHLKANEINRQTWEEEMLHQSFARQASLRGEKATVEHPRSQPTNQLTFQSLTNPTSRVDRACSSLSFNIFPEEDVPIASNMPVEEAESKEGLHARTLRLLALLENRFKQVKEYAHFIQLIDYFRQHVPTCLQILGEEEENEWIQRTFDVSMSKLLRPYFHRFADEMLEKHEHAMMTFQDLNKKITKANAAKSFHVYFTQGLNFLLSFTSDVTRMVRDWIDLVPHGKQELSNFIKPMEFANMRFRSYLYDMMHHIVTMSVQHSHGKSSDLHSCRACQRLQEVHVKLLENSPFSFPTALHSSPLQFSDASISLCAKCPTNLVRSSASES